MALYAPKLPTSCRPFTVGTGASATGARLGGRAPKLEPWPQLHPAAEYFLTLPLQSDPELFISVFRNCGPDEIWDAMNAGFRSDASVFAVAHPDVPRRDDDLAASVLSAHPLLIADVTDDWMDSGEPDIGRLVRAGSKIGGRPFCIQEPELEGADELLAAGYLQVAQFDASNPSDALVSGNLPFGDGLLNLFWKAPWNPREPRWAFQK